MSSLRQWLESIGLARYAESFERDRIDFDVLGELSEQDLEKLGVALGDRKRLLKAIGTIGQQGARTTTRPSAGEPVVERRQVTVAFIDLSGYTQLTASLGAEATHALIRRFRETADRIIVSHGGVVERHLGDAVMAVFGLPAAHGNDPERALRAVQAIHDAMPALSSELGQELRVHAGVASGQVIASRESDGTGFATVGDAVNLAARLVSLAASGETVLSGAVQRAAGRTVEVEPIGEVAVKGFASPVRAWRLRAWRATAPLGDRTPVFGRQAELERFRALCRGEPASGAAQVLLVRGEAGIGKTRLIEEFEAIAGEAGFAVHKGLTLDFGMGRAQDAIGRIVTSLLDGGATAQSRQAALESAVEQQILDDVERMFAADLMDVPLSAQARRVYHALTDAARAAGRRELVGKLVRRASMERPVLVVVEDVHWGGEELMQTLAALGTGIKGERALLVMTSRPEADQHGGVWRSLPDVLTLDLAPLEEPVGFALARALGIADEELVAQCVRRAGGNPLFLEQLLRNAAATEQETVPGSIQSIVLARLDRLEVRDRRAAQAASVLGQRFSLPVLRHLIGDPGYAAAALLEEQLLRTIGEELLFAHALIWEGTYASLLSEQKRAWHAAAAEWHAQADPALAAEHLERAGDERATRAYLDAARAEHALQHIARALELLERAERIARQPADALAVLLELGELLTQVGRVREAIDVFRRAQTLAGNGPARCRATIGVAAAMRMGDQRSEAMAVLDEATTLASTDAERAQIHYLRGSLRFPLGDVKGGLAEHGRALEYARRADSVELQLRALSGLGDAHYAGGRLVSSTEHYRECVEMSRKHGYVQVEVANLPMVGICSYFIGRLDDAMRYTDDGFALAQRTLNRRAEIICHHTYTLLHLQRCDEMRALVHAERSVDLAREIGATRFEPEGVCFVADCLLRSGRREEALALYREALDLAARDTISYFGPSIMGGLARAGTDPDERRRWLAAGEQVLQAGAPAHNHFSFYGSAIEVALELRQWGEARRCAEALEAYFREEPVPHATYIAGRARVLAAAGEGRLGAEERATLERLRARARADGLMAGLTALDRLAQR